MSSIIIHVELSEFREKVFRALPCGPPHAISLPDLTRKIYKTHDGKNKQRRSHVMKALYDLGKLRLAYHTIEKEEGRWWRRPKYYGTSMSVRVSRKKRK